ncbi:MAG: flavodoxin domain-containing protein, partial [Candidatus Krumholzibacteria bacterium]|nr:flavodoxin domain-containing protein [Candidatus Krumholzibacteria bacterium]
MKACRAVKITDSVYWVGAIDWDLRNFHGYSTGRGTTYNAYLVMADRIALVDTVKAPFIEEMLARIRSVVDPSKIDCIISNHAEMDHTGALPRAVELIEPGSVYASKKGAEALEAHFGLTDVEAVEDGGTIDLGSHTVTCLETRLLHWPDSMVTHVSPDRVLFSQDGFGMHLASNERFDDEIDDYVLLHEAAKYYANILMLYSHIVRKTLAKIEESGLPIDVIAPDHGPVWRSKIPWILDLYNRWSARELRKKAVIVYDTMWDSTRMMARAIEDGLTEGGVHVKLFNATATGRSDIMTEMIDAAALVVGSPTLNNHLFPTIADVLVYLQGLRPTGLVGAAFGSYGWSGEGVRVIAGMLEDMKVELVG